MTNSIVYRTLGLIVVRLGLVIAVTTVLALVHLQQLLQIEMLGTLDRYVQERGTREEKPFTQAQKNHEAVSAVFLETYENLKDDEAESEFSRLVKKYPDGIWRNADPKFDGRKTAGIFIGKGAPLTLDHKKKVIAGFRTVQRFGVAFHPFFQDFYFSFSENSIVLYWPEDPNWVFHATESLKIHEEIYHAAATPERNPDRRTVWTDLFLDEISRLWMTTATTPLYLKDKYIGNVSHDVMVTEILDRSVGKHLDGADNFILTKDGKVIAAPHLMGKIQVSQGMLKISDANDPRLGTLWETLRDRPNSHGSFLAESKAQTDLVAHYQLQGPGWIFVTAYPRNLIWWKAMNNAGWVLGAGIFSLALEILILLHLLVTRVRRPLRRLVRVTEKFAKGDYQAQIDHPSEDEIGMLAESFNSMAIAIRERDEKIERHNTQLENLVQQRTQELEYQKLMTLQSARLSALGEMAAGIAHEINTPLATIGLQAERLQSSSQASEHVQRISSLISTSVSRISHVIEGLRIFSNNENVHQFRPEKLDALIWDALNLCQEKFRLQEIQVQVRLHGEDFELECQAPLIIQVLLSLMNNSSDAISKMHEKWMLIEARSFPEEVRVYFTDSGPGLPPVARERLFQPFYTTKDIGKGVGMGLSISKGVIESHQGRIELNIRHVNTQFVIILPRRQRPEVKRSA